MINANAFYRGRIHGLLLASWLLLPASFAGSARLLKEEDLPLRTHGYQLLDRKKRPVRLACVNWYGAQTEQMVVNGLNKHKLQSIAERIVALRFNCVRVPFSLEIIGLTLVPNEVEALGANLELRGLSAQKVLDVTIGALTSHGLLVILENHVARPAWYKSFEAEQAWMRRKYDEDVWLRDLGVFVARYALNKRVLGLDLRNEPPWPWLGVGENASTSWAVAAVKGAVRAIDQNDNLLIFLSGVYAPMTFCGVSYYAPHQSELKLQGRTLYAPHEDSMWCFPTTASEVIGYYFLAMYIMHASFISLIVVFLRLRGFSLAAKDVMIWCRSGGWERAWWLLLAILSSWLFLFSVCVGRFISVYGQMLGFLPTLVYIYAPMVMAAASIWVWFYTLLIYTLYARCGGCKEKEDDGARRCDDTRYVPIPTVSGRQCMTASELKAPPSTERKRPQKQSPAEPVAGFARWARRRPERVLGAGEQALRVYKRAGNMLIRKYRSTIRCLLRSPRNAIFAVLSPFLLLEESRRHCTSYDAFRTDLDRRWGFLVAPSIANIDKNGVIETEVIHRDRAPIWLAEFGTEYNSLWWRHMMRYLCEHDINWAYASLNGERRRGVSDMYSLLEDDMSTVRHDWKLEALSTLLDCGVSEPGTAAKEESNS